MLSFLNEPTRYLFFTGKGGVGKTSLACASAVHLADAGRPVLLVSTDPASNLEQVLEAPVGSEAAPVESVPNLSAVNIDPEEAADEYRERVLDPMMGVLPDDAVEQVEEQLSGACTTEVASFDKFTRFLADAGSAAAFDHVVFDTAPTGHTLRLLELPAAWSDYIEENPEGVSCLGPASGLEAHRERYTAAVEALRDGGRTTLVLVSRPEGAALEEAARSSRALSDLDITNQRLVVNGVFRSRDPADPLARAMDRRGEEALDAMPDVLADLPRETVPLKGYDLVGLDALRSLLSEEREPESTAARRPEGPPGIDLPSLRDLVDGFADEGRGLITVMGKGGVGKTTVAASVAVELASRGEDVLLSTTDPAAHVTDAVGRAGITPYAWVVNQSLAAAGPSDPLLVERAHREVPEIEAVRGEHAERVALAPWMPKEPVGPERLRAFAAGRSRAGPVHA